MSDQGAMTGEPSHAIETVITQDVVQSPLIQRLEGPFGDLILGGGILLLVMVIHAAGVRVTSSHVLRRSEVLMRRPSAWSADFLMIITVALLLSFHIFEMATWAASLSLSALVPDLRRAALYACNAYTTLGSGGVNLPDRWKLVTPFIAMSGIFAFGWSGSVLVDLVGRCQQIRDAALRR